MSQDLAEELNFYKSRVLEILGDKTVEQLLPYDLKLTLFGAGLMTYRRESALRPFPAFLVKDDEKQFELTYESFDSIPYIDQINGSTNLSSNTWRLLHWIISQDSVKLELTKCEEKPNLFNKFQPNYLFKVVTREKERFIKDKRKYGSFVGFHGSQVENFHSILYNGLLNCLNKRDLYGSGTYLSTRIEVAVEFSPFGGGFKNSLLGRRISCIAMCEVVKSPQIEECKGKSSVPSEYRLVKNDDHVQLTHILVYSEGSGKGNKFNVLLIAVFMIILAIALSNSPLLKNTFHKLFR